MKEILRSRIIKRNYINEMVGKQGSVRSVRVKGVACEERK